MDATGSFEVPWVEKYRPEFLSDVCGNSEAISRLQAIAQLGNLPNILLSGNYSLLKYFLTTLISICSINIKVHLELVKQVQYCA